MKQLVIKLYYNYFMNSFKSFFVVRILVLSFLVNVPSGLLGQKMKVRNTIKIGLLIHDESHVDAQYAAEFAIEEANLKSGINGRKFELLTHSMEGPWGTGSKKAVDLIFQDEVWAIIGSHNGRNAHLVEQVAAKTQTIFLSAWATDPTLSKAFIPWYFNCVSNSENRAASISKEIYQFRNLKKVISISDNSYDSNQFLNSFIITSESKGYPRIVQLTYNSVSENSNNLIEQLKKNDLDGVLLVGNHSKVIKILELIRNEKINLPIFSPFIDLGKVKLGFLESGNLENTIYVDDKTWSNPKWIEFKKKFFVKFKKEPSLIAAYAYDATAIIIEAILNSGFNKENILPYLSKMDYNGVTGTVQFDKNGNRIGKVNLLEFKNGFSNRVVR